MKSTQLDKVPLMKHQSYYEPQSHASNDLANDIGDQIEKIYETFYNCMVKKDYLLPHHSNLFTLPP